MKRFVGGEDRRQTTLLPDCVDDFVGGDNPVRVVDAFVAALDPAEPGSDGAVPERTGRPAHHPAALLKIYVHGCLNRVRSSRRLEREAGRNPEPMWLTGRLAPDFKTAAGFRGDNGPAVRATCRRFVLLCRELDLLSDDAAAIDGSKFKAANAREKNHAHGAVRRRMEQIGASVARYLAAPDTADRQDDEIARARAARLKEKLAGLERRMRRLREMGAAVRAAPDGRVSPADPDARATATSGKGAGLAGCNVQAAVDTKHHPIVAHEVANTGNDRARLPRMAGRAREAMGHQALTALADRGYFDGEEILARERAGATPLVPKPLASGAKAEGRSGKQDFVHVAEADGYRCPGGGRLTWRFDNVEHGMTLRSYWASACPTCPTEARCTAGRERRIRRWEHEGAIDAVQRRLDRRPDAMRVRRRTAEHPFGSTKTWMGATRFLTRTPKRVGAGMSLQVLACNMKRAIAIKGASELVSAVRA